MREVTHCDRPTVTEAWALVLGRPVPVVAEEPAAIALAAKRLLPALEREPALVVAEVPAHGPVVPFWSQQWSWDHFRARIGHRYLSVHSLAGAERTYETYEGSLKPAIDPWLDACSRTYDDPVLLAAVEQVGFGYINAFELPALGFDLSTYFHVDFGVKFDDPPHDGLDGLEFKFSYRDKAKPSAQVMVQMTVRTGAGESLVVRTKTTATTSVVGFWRDRRFIEDNILEAKAVAKRAFFELVTVETRETMGVHYGDSA